MATKRIDVKGPIIPNSYKWIYDYFEEDSTCPKDVDKVLNDGTLDDIEIYINSGGGDVFTGSEIYTAIRNSHRNIKIFITGVAASAASVIAMSGHCEMSPTASMMIHNASTYASGDYRSLEHAADVTQTINETIRNAYIAKTGKSGDEFKQLMDNETWFTAQQAKDMGLIDGIMFENEQPQSFVASAGCCNIIPQSVINKMLAKKQHDADIENKLRLENQLKFLKLKGEIE